MGRDARIPSLPETLSRCGQSLAEAREAGLTISSSSSSDQPSEALYQSLEFVSTGGFDLVFGKKPGNCGAEVGETG